MLGKKEDQRPYAFLTEEVKADLKVLALGRTMKPEFFQEETWEALNGNTFWELCDTLFPGKRGIGDLTQAIHSFARPQIQSAETTHESKMREVFTFVSRIMAYLSQNKISADLEAEGAVIAMKSKLPKAIQCYLSDSMQEIIDKSTRKRPAADGGGMCEGHHVVGTALQALARMSLDNDLIGMRALLMHETRKPIEKEKGKDAPSNKEKKKEDSKKKKERWNESKKQEAKKNGITCFQCGKNGHRSTECRIPEQNAEGKAAQEASQSRRGKEKEA